MSLFWACAQTHPRQEQIALLNLRRQNFTAFYPFFMSKKLRHGKPSGDLVMKAAFPGYVFIQLDEYAVNWSPINFTLGVRKLLTYLDSEDEDAYRLPCRADFIDGLRKIRILADQAGQVPNLDIIPVGTMIRIKRGAFSERLALVALSDVERVAVILEVFNRDVRIDFDVGDVERAA